MQVIKTSIPDVLIFEPKVFGDDRGYFMESFREDVFREHVGEVKFVQDNESKSGYGVLRGLHFQKPPYTQSKLVRAIRGEVLDVAVDLREGSPTYGQHVAVRLSEQNKRQLWVPKGFAHGFVVLSEEAVFAYKCDNYYAPDYDAGLAFDDPSLNIDWMVEKEQLLLSGKDKNHPVLAELEKVFEYGAFCQEAVY